MRKKSGSGTSDTHKSARHAAYQRGSQREGSPHYVFLYSEDESEDEGQALPLETRNRTQTFPRKVEVINVQVQSEDTLQALALRYRCTISELRRINNIHKDNEIHAHRTIKVPVPLYSLLTETLDQNSEINQDKELIASVSGQGDNISVENQIINVLSIPPPTSSSAIEINNIILNSTVEPLSQFNNETSHFSEETDQLISSTEHDKTTPSSNIVNTFKCSGADWGLSWYQLLCFSLLLGFAAPIIYVLYIAESSKHHNSS